MWPERGHESSCPCGIGECRFRVLPFDFTVRRAADRLSGRSGRRREGATSSLVGRDRPKPASNPRPGGVMTMPSAMQVQPYLFFEGRCEEALAFYRGALGAEVTMLMRFKESPDPGMVPPGTENKVMHASFRIGETTVMASDGRCLGNAELSGLCALADGAERGRGRAAVRRAGRRRAGADADDQDLLFPALRHGRRPLRRVLDGLRDAMSAGHRGEPR